MATPAKQVILELQQVQRYLESQRTLLGEASLQQQAEVWVMKLQQTCITAEEAVNFVNLIKTGPWTDTQQKALGMAVNTSVLQATVPGNARRALQEVPDFSGYLSANDHKVLADPGISGARKMEQVACRLIRLGIHTPSELALRHIFSIALKTGLQCPQDPDNLKLSFNEFKRIMKSTCKGAPRLKEHLVKYPCTPAELPCWLFQEAYDETDQPESLKVSQAELAGQAAMISCRSNNKLLTKNKVGSQVALVGPQSQLQGFPMMGMPADPAAAMQMWQQMMMMSMMGGPNLPQQQLAAQVPSLQFMKPQSRQTKALADIPTVEGTLAAACGGLANAMVPADVKEENPIAPQPGLSRALSLPDLTPEAQVQTVASATLERNKVRDEAKAAAAAKKASATAEADKSKELAKPKAKAGGKAKAKGKAKGTAKAKAKAKVVKSEEPPTPETGGARVGKSSYGVAKDAFKKAFQGDKSDFEAAWRDSAECQKALAAFSFPELKKRRLDHLWIQDKD